MTTYHGLIIEAASTDPETVLRRLGCGKITTGLTQPSLLIELLWSMPEDESAMIGRRASTMSHSALVLRVQTTSDIYNVVEYVAGECVRRILFDRDSDPQWKVEGAPRPWEADLVFALPADDFIDYLSDDDRYTDTDLEAARRAHAARDLASLPQRPPLLSASVWEWMRRMHLDPKQPHARL